MELSPVVVDSGVTLSSSSVTLLNDDTELREGLALTWPDSVPP